MRAGSPRASAITTNANSASSRFASGPANDITAARRRLRDAQCGSIGTLAQGEFRSLAEDLGWVDVSFDGGKNIARDGLLPLSEAVLCLSGRVSFELVRALVTAQITFSMVLLVLAGFVKGVTDVARRERVAHSETSPGSRWTTRNIPPRRFPPSSCRR